MKKGQSELGITGELSPNIEVIKKLKPLLRSFDHTHETITEDDCMIYMSMATIGVRYGSEKREMSFQNSVIGCNEDLEELFVHFFVRHPDLIVEVAEAMKKAILYVQTFGPGDFAKINIEDL